MIYWRDRRIDTSKITFCPIVKFDTPWIVLGGDPGSGKTTQALGYLSKWEGWEFLSSVGFWHEAKSYKQSSSISEVLKIAANHPRLIIDDLGFEPDTKFTTWGTEWIPKEEMKDILFMRHAERLPTILVTNLDTDQLFARYEDRIYQRIKELATFYWFTGSWREKIPVIIKRNPHKPLISKTDTPINPDPEDIYSRPNISDSEFKKIAAGSTPEVKKLIKKIKSRLI